jgi:hypothetical protein
MNGRADSVFDESLGVVYDHSRGLTRRASRKAEGIYSFDFSSSAEGFGVRKVATTTMPDAAFRRAMVYDPADGRGGVYVFLFRSLDDGPCDADYMYEDVAGAELHAAAALGGGAVAWELVPDPPPGCQDDWVAPVQVARDAAGRPIFGRFDRLG